MGFPAECNEDGSIVYTTTALVLTPGVILLLVALGAASVFALGVFAFLAVGYRRTTLHKDRQRVRKAFRALQERLQGARGIIDRAEDAALTSARRYAETQEEHRIRETPVEALKDAGATHVRYGALRDDGLDTLGKIRHLDEKTLEDVNGIGPASARSLVEARNRLMESIRNTPPPPPGADLEELHAPELARTAVHWARADAGLGGLTTEFHEYVKVLGERKDRLDRAASVGGWVWTIAGWRDDPSKEVTERADRFCDEAEEILEGPLAGGIEEERRSLATRERETLHGEKIWDFAQENYAELTAAVETALERALSVKVVRGIEGGIPSDIARKVERFRLDLRGLQVTLRRYQTFGAKYILAQERTLLGDEMGLGKTIEALGAMTHLWNAGKGGRFLVVAPAGILPNWAGEITKRAPFSAYVLHGHSREKALAQWVDKGGAAVTSYDTLRVLPALEALEKAGKGIDLITVDEAHYIKNPSAKRTMAVTALLPRAGHVCLMTGTPLENDLDEFRFLIRTVRPEHEFKDDADPILLDGTLAESSPFHREISYIYLRRNQEDVLTELPDKIEVPEWVELNDADLHAYRGAVLDGNFMRMRLTATVGAKKPPSAKMERLRELLEEHRISNRKVLVFSFFLDVLDAAKNLTRPVGVISGSLAPAKRQGLVDEFTALEGHQVLLSQIEAGGTGLNIQAASAVVLMEPQFKPSTEVQAIARAHRMGQTRKVLVHRLLTRDSVDERLLEMLAEKQDLFDAYAKESLVKKASREAVSTSTINRIIELERERHGAPPLSGAGGAKSQTPDPKSQ